MSPLLSMKGIVKDFPGVRALNGVDFFLHAGQVHCLVGENGAGKSTLIRILSGALLCDAGSIAVDGVPATISSPADALALGVSVIHQELMLVPQLTVAENILLGVESRISRTPFLDRAAMRRTAQATLALVEEDIDPDAVVGELSPGRQQIVEIAKALSRKARMLVLDEPSAALTGHEVKNLFRIIRRLKHEGVGVIFVSHRLEEVFAIGDAVTVLRDGAVAHSGAVAETDQRRLVGWMVGREQEPEYVRPLLRRGRGMLRVDQLSGGRVRDVSFSVDRGEVFGLAGLVGSGRSEVARLIFGADRKESGKVFLENEEVNLRSPSEAIAKGIGFLTEDRNRFGLLLQMSVRENISLAALSRLMKGPVIDRRRERALVDDHVTRLRIRTSSREARVDTLSGGNRQKVVLARWLSTDSRLFIFDEPTAGVDVGAKREIHMLINRLAEEGKAVIIVSSDLPEILTLCDRIGVMNEGRLAGIIDRSEATEEKILLMGTQTAAEVHRAG